MNYFGWGFQAKQIESMTAGCKIGSGYILCNINEGTGSVFICTSPTTRIQESLMDLLDTNISISIENVLIEGTLSFYTIEESSYRIGITIARKDRSIWRKILAGRYRPVINTSTRTASI